MKIECEEWTAEQTLDAVESWHAQRLRAEAGSFVAAAHFADLYNADTLGAVKPLPGMERGVRIGGVGVPLTAEFAVVELGTRMQLGPVAARYYLADALDCRHRLPRIWARLVAGEVRVGWARQVATQTRPLSREAAAVVDAGMVEVADGRISYARFLNRLEGQVVAADPERAARMEAEEAEREYARPSRSGEHGMRGFHLRSTAGAVARVDATVAYLADALQALGDTDNEDRRRAKAMLVLANPTQAVELLAAFAAHRAGNNSEPPPDETGDAGGAGIAGGGESVDRDGNGAADRAETDGETDGEADPELPLDTDPDAEPDPPEDPEDAEDADVEDTVACPTCGHNPTTGDQAAFVQPQRFRPTDLPGWLTRMATGIRADAGGETDPEHGPDRPQWRFAWTRLLPQLTLYVHVSGETVLSGEGVARYEGEGTGPPVGPVTWQHVRERLLGYSPARITPVIDLAGQEPVDAYEIPARHRQAVHLRTPADCFPHASGTTRKVDLDHTEKYQHAEDGTPAEPGQSAMGNYAPLGRFHHRIKTHGGWSVKQPYDGIYIWRDPHGVFYLVDHTGTRKITAA